MARHSVTLIPGDGVGPEICDAAVRVIEATGVGFDWDVQQAGEAANGARGHVGLTTDAPVESVKAFRDRFVKKYNYVPDHNGLKGYLAYLWYIPGYAWLADRQYKRIAASRYQRDASGRLKEQPLQES